MPGKTRRELPVRKCEACGGEFFRETTVHQWLQPTAKALVRNPSGQLSRMSLTILVCLCGAPQPWKLGGLRGGRTPNGEISRFLDSFGVASAEAERRNDPASVLTAAEERLVKRKDLQAVSAALAEQERAVGRLLSGKHPTRRADNACWRPPKRKPAARFGRDWLAIELQKRGFNFRKARAIVKTIFDAITDALKRGERVPTPMGTFVVKERTAIYQRVRPRVRRQLQQPAHAFRKMQTMHKVPKIVVLKPKLRAGDW